MVRRARVAAAAALVVALGVVALVVTRRHTRPTPIALCTMGDPNDPRQPVYAHVIGTDTIFVMDSAAWSHVDRATVPAMAILSPCNLIKRSGRR